MERDQATKFINDLLKLMVSRNGSDLFITAEFPPAIKIDGRITKVSPQPLSPVHRIDSEYRTPAVGLGSPPIWAGPQQPVESRF